jgi:hypothetical protein
MAAIEKTTAAAIPNALEGKEARMMMIGRENILPMVSQLGMVLIFI